jgi:hypothetical protein
MLQKLEPTKPVVPIEIDMTQYVGGVLPCRSSLLPASLRQLSELRSRPGELMLGYCVVNCSARVTVHNLTDEQGIEVDTVMLGHGFHQAAGLSKKLPQLSPLVKRKTMMAKEGSAARLNCPM